VPTYKLWLSFFLLLTLVDGSVESILEFPRTGSCDCPPIIFDPENEEETLRSESFRIQGQKEEAGLQPGC